MEDERTVHCKIITDYLFSNAKDEFQRIMQNARMEDLEFLFGSREHTVEKFIETHVSSWYTSRILGVSAGLAFYAELPQGVQKIDECLMRKEWRRP